MFSNTQTFSTVLERFTPWGLVADVEFSVEITGWFDGHPTLGRATATSDAPLYLGIEPTGECLFRAGDEITLEIHRDARGRIVVDELRLVEERAEEFFVNHQASSSEYDAVDDDLDASGDIIQFAPAEDFDQRPQPHRKAA